MAFNIFLAASKLQCFANIVFFCFIPGMLTWAVKMHSQHIVSFLLHLLQTWMTAAIQADWIWLSNTLNTDTTTATTTGFRLDKSICSGYYQAWTWFVYGYLQMTLNVIWNRGGQTTHSKAIKVSQLVTMTTSAGISTTYCIDAFT